MSASGNISTACRTYLTAHEDIKKLHHAAFASNQRDETASMPEHT